MLVRSAPCNSQITGTQLLSLCQHNVGRALCAFVVAPGPFPGTQVWSMELEDPLLLVAAFASLAFVFLLVALPFPEWRCPWPAAMLDAMPFVDSILRMRYEFAFCERTLHPHLSALWCSPPGGGLACESPCRCGSALVEPCPCWFRECV